MNRSTAPVFAFVTSSSQQQKPGGVDARDPTLRVNDNSRISNRIEQCRVNGHRPMVSSHYILLLRRAEDTARLSGVQR